MEVQGGSALVNFTIRFVEGGPTIPHMRERLTDRIRVQEAFGESFKLVQPYTPTLVEITQHRSNKALEGQLNAFKASVILIFVFMLLGAWSVVVFWTITVRGDSCRKRAHSGLRSKIVPTAETLQVVVLSSFAQLILSKILHLVMSGGTAALSGDADAANTFTAGPEYYNTVVLLGLGIGVLGTIFTALLNSWIRGESASLRAALKVDQIDKQPVWMDEGDDREYREIYEPGGARTLGQLAAHDWEGYHRHMEQAMGLFDMSEQVFDEVKPEKDPSLLASFLNSTLMGAFGGKKGASAQASKPAAPTELSVVPVELPPGFKRNVLRDAIMQWRLRHAAHPRELDAVDWLLGQLDPGFELIAVKVPEQARLLILEALLQHTQQHAKLQLDACHAVRVHSSMQQLSNRFHEQEVELPDDGKGTAKVRNLVALALKARLEKPSKRDISQEEGQMLQHVLGAFSETSSLVCMPYHKGTAIEEQKEALDSEIQGRAELMREEAEAFDQYLYDDDIFTPVGLVSRTKPPDLIETLAGHGGGRQARKDRAKASMHKHHGRTGAAARAPATAPTAAPAVAAPAVAAPIPAPTASAAAPPAPAVSPPPSPPTQLPAPGAWGESQRQISNVPTNGAAADPAVAGEEEIEQVSVAKKLRIWWRFQRKRDAADHNHMPCWKQYLTLFIGSIVVGVFTITIVTVLSVGSALLDYFAVFSFAISLPTSLILHWVGRTSIRRLRKQMALWRGRSVEGTITRSKYRRRSNGDLEEALDDVEQPQKPWGFDTRASAIYNLEAYEAYRAPQHLRKQSVITKDRVSVRFKEVAEPMGAPAAPAGLPVAPAMAAHNFRAGVERAKSRGAAMGRAEELLKQRAAQGPGVLGEGSEAQTSRGGPVRV